ncbi:MAG: hypothetical protein ACE5JK_03220 [Candidatus Omnitrophota bacterium]
MIFDKIRKKLEEEEPLSPQEMPSRYSYWWRRQKITIVLVILFLVIGIVVTWWFVIFCFLFLGYNLYANYKRVRLLKRMHKLGIEFNPNLKREV